MRRKSNNPNIETARKRRLQNYNSSNLNSLNSEQNQNEYKKSQTNSETSENSNISAKSINLNDKNSNQENNYVKKLKLNRELIQVSSNSNVNEAKLRDEIIVKSVAGQVYKLNQNSAPLHQALEEYRNNRIVSFDVPGHKQGKGNKELTDFLGERCLSVDVNSMKPLDNLIHPVSVIKEAQEIAADAFGAKSSFFMVNGTSGAIQAMIMSTVKRGEKIIMPRNVHRSAINALIMTGAMPVYVDPSIDQDMGIPLGMSRENVELAIKKNPDAKSILVNNPTYYGVCADLKSIVNLAHKHGMRVLVDEAHGTHFYFGENMPISAMAAGADMSAVSLHKTGGSLTQSSLLLLGNDVDRAYVAQVINLNQTTSASYLLMSSLDIARKNLAINGKQMFNKIISLADYARKELELIGGYIPFSSLLCDGDAFFAFDRSKLSIHTRSLGLSGLEVYDLLRDEYRIQIEFGDLGNILAIISVGDRAANVERLLSALSEIKRLKSRESQNNLPSEYIEAEPIIDPQTAFYSEKESIPLEKSEGRIAAEFVMCYPPGIPIVAPGERIKKEVLDYIKSAKEHHASMTGSADPSLKNIKVIK